MKNSFFGMNRRKKQNIFNQKFIFGCNFSFFFFQHLTSLRVCPHCIWAGEHHSMSVDRWESADSRWLLRRATPQQSAQRERWQEVGSKELADTNGRGNKREPCPDCKTLWNVNLKHLRSGLPSTSASSCFPQIRFHSWLWRCRLEAPQPRSAHAESDWTNKLMPETWSDTL